MDQQEGISNFVVIEPVSDGEENGFIALEGQALVERDSEELQEVRSWMEGIAIAHYFDIFIENGFVTLHLIKMIEDKYTLIDMGITLKAHQLLIMHEIRKLKMDDTKFKWNIHCPSYLNINFKQCINNINHPRYVCICALISIVLPWFGILVMFLIFEAGREQKECIACIGILYFGWTCSKCCLYYRNGIACCCICPTMAVILLFVFLISQNENSVNDLLLHVCDIVLGILIKSSS